MKIRKTILMAAAMTGLAFVLMLATPGLVLADTVATSGSKVTQNGSNYFWAELAGNQAALMNSAASIGSYELYFYASRRGTLEETSSMPVGSGELILRAYVEDSLGVPATGGTAIFEYCSYKGLPTNDIERPDEAPKEACDDGRVATWRRIWSLALGTCGRLGPGACMNFGGVRIPRVVGFRFRFRSGTTGIDPGISDAANFTWTAALSELR